MSDYIDRQAAINAAINADMENNSNVLSEKRARVIDRHISAVPSAQPEPHWIPVSERLPDDLGDYLVSIKRIGWNMEEYVENDIAYWDDLEGFHKADEVLAWMPLPEPYKEEACKIALMGKSLAEIKEIEGIPVERMKVLAKAEAEGRLVVLPCKTVFEPTWDAGKDCDLVCPVLIGGEECCGLCEKAELFVYERPCKQDDIDRIGKSVFLTREEAEAALKGAEGGEDE